MNVNTTWPNIQGLSIINGRLRPKSELLMGEQHADARLQQYLICS